VNTGSEWWYKRPISGCVIAAAGVKTIGGAATPFSVETGIVMVAPVAVDTLAPTVGADACVDYAYEEDCDDCDDVEVPPIHYWCVEPLLSKLYHFLNACTDKYFSRKIY
jgi:hypothetical protein